MNAENVAQVSGGKQVVRNHYIPKDRGLSVSEMKRLFYVDGNGVVRNKIDRSKAKKGQRSGWDHNSGHIRIKISKNTIAAHHIAWVLYYGEWPDAMIDHIDGDSHNNRKSNLRKADPATNARNAKMRNDNKSGVSGYRVKVYNLPFDVQWMEGGKRRSKAFETEFEAQDYLKEIDNGRNKAAIRYKVARSPHIVYWSEQNKLRSKAFKTKEEALVFKIENDSRLREVYGYTERHGKAA